MHSFPFRSRDVLLPKLIHQFRVLIHHVVLWQENLLEFHFYFYPAPSMISSCVWAGALLRQNFQPCYVICAWAWKHNHCLVAGGDLKVFILHRKLLSNGNRIRTPVIISIRRINCHERYLSLYPHRLSSKKKSEFIRSAFDMIMWEKSGSFTTWRLHFHYFFFFIKFL